MTEKVDIIEQLNSAYRDSLDECMTVPLKAYSGTINQALNEILDLRAMVISLEISKEFLLEKEKEVKHSLNKYSASGYDANLYYKVGK